jgi:DNA-binding IscR family transcriptional regulator
MSDWKFLTNHALVLGRIALDPASTAREIAFSVGVTERTTLKIVGKLEAAGYITRSRKGRRNVYGVDAGLSLRNPIEPDVPVGDLLAAIAPKRRRASA